MPNAIAFPLLVVDSMVLQYASGASLSDLAVSFGVAKNTARKVLIARGVVFTKEGKNIRIAKKAQGRHSTRKGVVLSEATKAKMAETRRSRTYPITSHRRVFSDATKEKMRQSALLRWAKNIQEREEKAARKVVRSVIETRQMERVRLLCKRLVRRVLKATGRCKEIPSEKYLGYTKMDFLRVVGHRPDGYELDHIVPVAEFVRRGITDPAVINALCNLRFIPQEQNRAKSDKLPSNTDALIQQALTYSGKSYGRVV